MLNGCESGEDEAKHIPGRSVNKPKSPKCEMNFLCSGNINKTRELGDSEWRKELRGRNTEGRVKAQSHKAL